MSAHVQEARLSLRVRSAVFGGMVRDALDESQIRRVSE